MMRSFHDMIRIYPQANSTHPVAYRPFLRIDTTSFPFYLAYLYRLSWDQVEKQSSFIISLHTNC